jgi:hypothetical protein
MHSSSEIILNHRLMIDVGLLEKWVEKIEECLFKEKIDYMRDSRKKRILCY